uniref:D-arabinono-1,4-lactone oxidase C-terminal domain-containing protein n=1 Tax=Salix viminalis TaxID=40686 RepID=A0A6N2LB61_SALVM
MIEFLLIPLAMASTTPSHSALLSLSDWPSLEPQDTQESMKDPDGRCASAKLITSALIQMAYGLTNNGLVFTGYPIIGYHNRLQSSGTCLDSPEDALITACPWDSRIKGEYFFQATFSISLSVVKNFIQDVQKLVKMEPRALCGLEQYNGILMRYVKASSAYLGKEDDALDFDITFYRNKNPAKPRLYEDILEEIEQLAVFKYGGLPHWGKNRNLVFSGALEKYNKGGAFLRVKEKYDPLGLFSNEWTDQVLGLKGETRKNLSRRKGMYPRFYSGAVTARDEGSVTADGLVVLQTQNQELLNNQ